MNPVTCWPVIFDQGEVVTMLDDNKSINEIAALTAKHKVVPFLGAGSSVKHLNIDWDALVGELASELGSTPTGNLEIAEEYERKFGKVTFCDYLKRKLSVDDFDESKDILPLITLSLGIGLIYTTNQDNVFELCAMQYGRKFKKIIKLEDFSTSYPGDCLYIKYHGDIDDPDSIIFTTSSYDNRIKDVDHFLNIRMRSDLLAKSFLFLGYSFRDPNIIKLFEELNSAFRGKLPSSYLIAYKYTPELEELNHKFGVKIIDPVKELENKYPTEQAFELYLSALCRKSWYLKSSEEIEEMFRPSVPTGQMVVTKYEIEASKQKIAESPIDESIDFFRATFDGVLIPEIYHEMVSDLFVDLASKCVTRNLSDMLTGAAFNLIIKTEHAIKALAAVMATAQFRGGNIHSIDIFLPHVKTVTDDLRPLCTAYAIELLRDWNVKIDDNFRSHVTHWIEGYDNLPEKLVEYIKSQVDCAWLTPTTFEHPFSYWKRVGSQPLFQKRSFQEIRDGLMSNLPKKFSKPYEE